MTVCTCTIPYRNVKVVTSLLQGGLVAERLLQPGKQVVTALHCGCHSAQLIYNLVKDMASAPQLKLFSYLECRLSIAKSRTDLLHTSLANSDYSMFRFTSQNE